MNNKSDAKLHNASLDHTSGDTTLNIFKAYGFDMKNMWKQNERQRRSVSTHALRPNMKNKEWIK